MQYYEVINPDGCLFNDGDIVRHPTDAEREKGWTFEGTPITDLYIRESDGRIQHRPKSYVKEIDMTTKSADVLDDIFEILNTRREATKEEAPKAEPAKPVEALVATDWVDHGDGKRSRSVPFSELFWAPKHYPDHLVRVFDGWAHEEVPGIYIPPVKEFEQLSLGFHCGLKQNVVGPTGCGKTQMVEYYAAATGRPYMRISHDQAFDKCDVFGQVHITGGDTDFVPGRLPKCMDSPTLVLLDELTRATGGANMVYGPLLDRRELCLPELKDTEKAVIKPHEDWLICASDNTKGNGDDMDKYSESNVQDGAFLNRWDMVIEADYLTQAQEEKLLAALAPTMAKPEVRSVAKFSALIHAGYKKGDIVTAFSPRNLQAIAKLCKAGVKTKEAIHMNYVSRVSKSEMTDVMECLRSTFGD